MRGSYLIDQYHSMYSTAEKCAQTVIVHCAVPRRLAFAVVAVVAALVPTACAYEGLGVDRYAAFSARGDGAIAAATPSAPAAAITYNPTLAPIGGHMTASLTPSGDSTTADLTVSGLAPNRGFSVVAHANTCGGVPGGEGPRFQKRIDPAASPGKPSTNPEYSNPTNEIWLRTAPGPEGPWGPPARVVGQAPPPEARPATNYAAVEHPELAKAGGRTVLISYYRPLAPTGVKGELRLMEVTFK